MLANIFEVSFLFHPCHWVVSKSLRETSWCWLALKKKNLYSSQDGRDISLGVLLAINILRTHYFSMLCRNLFFAVSSFLIWIMFLNLQAPRHPVLWRKDVQWYWEALSLDNFFWLQILCRDCHKVSCWCRLYSSLFIIVEFIRWTYISHIIGHHGGGVGWGRGPSVPVNSLCELLFLSKQP